MLKTDFAKEDVANFSFGLQNKYPVLSEEHLVLWFNFLDFIAVT